MKWALSRLRLIVAAVAVATSATLSARGDYLTFDIASNEAMADSIRFESRSWAEGAEGEGGRFAANTTWSGGEHVILNDLYIPSGVTLTINAGTVVKFREGTRIKVEEGGSIVLNGELGNEVVLEGYEDDTAFTGIVLQSGSAGYSDNGYVILRGMAFGKFATVSISDTEAFMGGGQALVPVNVSGSRDTAFSFDWVAETNGVQFASGTMNWNRVSDGSKNITVPYPDGLPGCSNFTVRATTLRCCTASKGACEVNLSEFITTPIYTHEAMADCIPFESRDWAEGMEGDGGRLSSNVVWCGTHKIVSDVYIPSGVTLTLSADTVVEFCEGTRIKIEDGGKLDIVGADGHDVILRGAEGVSNFVGIVKMSSGTFADNGYVQAQGWTYSAFAGVSMHDSSTFRSSGLALIPVSVSGSRSTVFSIDWIAETNGVTYKTGTMTWNNVSEGRKNITLEYGSELDGLTNFTVRVSVERACHASPDSCNVKISDFVVTDIYSHETMADYIAFESREWAAGMEGEGGRLDGSATWSGTHKIVSDVYIPSGVTLTLSADTVVEFCEGTRIKIEDGGALNIVGANGHDVIIRGAEGVTNYVGIVKMPNGTYTDNMYVQYTGKPYSAYPYITVHEATTYRDAGKMWIAFSLSGTTRNQSFNIDWQTDKGDTGTVTWASSSDGTKWIELPIDAASVGGTTNHLITVTAARGCNVSVGEAVLTILEPDYIVKGTVAINESDEDSGEFAVNGDIKTQPLFLNPVERVQYSGKWQTYDANEAAALRVTIETDNGRETLKEVSPSETGAFDLDLTKYPVGYYTLKHEILDAFGETLATMQKTFSVADVEDVEMHGGTLTQNEVWKAGKVHVVYETVVVPSIYTIFIEPGAIVKFMTGTGIDISQGGAFFANGIVFTHINDDTVGGDTLNDGFTVAPPMDAYFLSGAFTFGDDTELRGITQNNALTGTIATQKTLSRGSTYRVSGTLTIANGGSLTIPPGTVLKMESGARVVVNSGATLNAIGTRAAPIVITSIKDDTISGDTNGDGDKTMPQPGDWRQIQVAGGMLNAAHLSMFYLSNDNNQGGLYVTGGEVSLDCCTIAHCNYDCMRATGGKGTVRNSVFADASIGVAPNGGAIEYVNCVFNGLTTAVRWPTGSFVNCVFSEVATTFFDSTGSTPIKNCVLWNPAGYGPQNVNGVVGTNGNIWADPLFVDSEKGDFRIVEGSPCVDAADGAVAPELDFYGQPRITITDHGDELVGQLADIGICEVMPRDVVSDIDLVPQSVRTTTNAVPGQLLFVKWEIANVGGREVEAAWRDTVLLVSESGREVVLGVKTTSSRIGVGGSVFCSAYFTVPAIAEGTWYPKVNVNSYHDIFEGSLAANNALKGERAVSVGLEGLDPSISREGVINAGMPTVLKLAFGENDDNRMVKFDVPSGVKATWGFGFMPGGSRFTASASGSAVASGDGVVFRVPDGATDVYVVFESDATTTYNLSTGTMKLAITGVTPNRISNNASSTVEISGGGLSAVGNVLLRAGSKIIVGNVTRQSDVRLSVTFNTDNAVAGDYEIVLVTDAGENTFGRNVLVFSNARGADVKVEIDAPESYRPGRWNVATVKYRNDGDEESLAPIINVSGSKITFRNPENDITYNEHIHLIGSSSTGDASVLKPGESGEIKLMFVTMESHFNIGINFSIPDEDVVAWESLFAKGDKTEQEWNDWLQPLRLTYGSSSAAGFYKYVLEQVSLCSDYFVRKKCVDDIYDMAIARATNPDVRMIVGTFENAESFLDIDSVIHCLSRKNGNRVSGNLSSSGQVVFCANDPELVFFPEDSNSSIDVVSCETNDPKFVSYRLKCATSLKDKDDMQIDDTPLGIVDSKFFKCGNFLGVATVDGQSGFYVGKLSDNLFVPSYSRKDTDISWENVSVVRQLDNSVTLAVSGHGETNTVAEILTFSIDEDAVNVMQDYRVEIPKYVYAPSIALVGDEYCPVYLDEDGYVLIDHNYVVKQNQIPKGTFQNSVRRLASSNEFQGFLAPKTISFGQKPFLYLSGTANWYSRPLADVSCCRWRQEMEMSAKSSVMILGAGIEIGYGAGMDVIAQCDGNDCSTPSKIVTATETARGNMGVLLITDKMRRQANGFIGGTNRRLGQSIVKALGKRLLKDELARIDKLFEGNVLKWKTGMPTFSGGGEFVSKKTYLGSFDNCVKEDWELMGYFNGSWNVNVSAHCYSFNVVNASLKWRAGVTKGPDLKSDGKLTVKFGNLATAQIGVESKLFGGYKTSGDWKVSIAEGHFSEKKYASTKTRLQTVPQKTDNTGYRSIGELASVYESENGFVVGNRGLRSIAANYVSWHEATPINGEMEIENRLAIVKLKSDGNLSKFLLPNLDVELSDVVVDADNWTAFVKESNNGVSTLYSVSGCGTNCVATVSIGDGAGVYQLRALQTASCNVLVYCKEEQGVNTLQLRHSTGDTWSTPVVVADMSTASFMDACMDGKNIVVSLSNTNGQQEVIFLTTDGRIENRLALSSADMVSSAFMSVMSSSTSVKRNTVLGNSRSGVHDGCSSSCNCGCVKYGCGCPMTCKKCSGNCGEDCQCGGGSNGDAVQSCDPNEMRGPLGIGDPETQRFVKPGEELTYTIYFENKTNATAAAQEVFVTNSLSQYLDWSTFKMHEVAFGDQIDLGLADKSSGTSEVTMKGTNFVVRTELVLEENGDAGTRDACPYQAKWYMRIVDPTTDTGWPKDIVTGFLPPNDETHRGEGHITYSIRVREDAPGNVIITNSADIVFDHNPAITTDPAWWNTVAPTTGNAKFNEAVVETEEGSNVVVRVTGGNMYAASSVKVYLTYNTAAAADVDLKKAVVIDGNRRQSDAGGSGIETTNLKFPLTLAWEKGEIGEKVITIPVKADKAVEDDEFFTLQLADAEGMEVGEESVCTVTIRDMNDKTLKAAVTAYKPKKGESVATNSVTVTGMAGGFVAGTGEYTSGSKLALTAEARPGWSFVGWKSAVDGDILSSKAKWQVVVTNDAEYVAVFEKIPYVRGLADPADGGKVSGSGYCAAGKKVTLKATASKNYAFVGWLKGSAAIDSGREPSTAIEYVATTPSLVIDRTAKPAKDSKTSTTITNVTEDVTYFAVFRSDPKVTVSVEATDGNGASLTGKGAGKYVAGTITGAGKYAPGKKATLKATANKGYVFAGWYDGGRGATALPDDDGRDGARPSQALLSQAASLSFEMPSNDVQYVASFVTAEEDKASIALSVNGAEMAAGAGHAPYQTNVWAGVYLEWPVAASALSEPKVKVAGLPAGLKFTDKPVTSKIGTGKTAVTVTNVLANTIYGAPTAASKIDAKTGAAKPSTVKITVTTAGKSTQTYQIDTVVDALPAWAQGTFAGGVYGDGSAGDPLPAASGTVALNIAANGKISGKLLEDGLAWTLSAPWFGEAGTRDAYPYQDPEDGSPTSEVGSPVFIATVIGKSGKREITNEVTVAEGAVGGIAMGGPRSVAADPDDGGQGLAAISAWTAWQYNWKAEPWNTLGKSFDKKTVTYAILSDGSFTEDDEALTSALGADVTGRVTLKFAASGAVSVAGEFVTGYDEKRAKYTTVKATGSATLVPVDEEHGETFIYLTPKGLSPHARSMSVPWPQE